MAGMDLEPHSTDTGWKMVILNLKTESTGQSEYDKFERNTITQLPKLKGVIFICDYGFEYGWMGNLMEAIKVSIWIKDIIILQL